MQKVCMPKNVTRTAKSPKNCRYWSQNVTQRRCRSMCMHTRISRRAGDIPEPQVRQIQFLPELLWWSWKKKKKQLVTTCAPHKEAKVNSIILFFKKMIVIYLKKAQIWLSWSTWRGWNAKWPAERNEIREMRQVHPCQYPIFLLSWKPSMGQLVQAGPSWSKRTQ